MNPLNFSFMATTEEQTSFIAQPLTPINLNGFGSGMHEGDGFGSGCAGPHEVLRPEFQLWNLVPIR